MSARMDVSLADHTCAAPAALSSGVVLVREGDGAPAAPAT
jgi:hypothetical protein